MRNESGMVEIEVGLISCLLLSDVMLMLEEEKREKKRKEEKRGEGEEVGEVQICLGRREGKRSSG